MPHRGDAIRAWPAGPAGPGRLWLAPPARTKTPNRRQRKQRVVYRARDRGVGTSRGPFC